MVYLSLWNIYYNYFIDALILECAGEIEKAVKIHKKISIYDIKEDYITFKTGQRRTEFLNFAFKTLFQLLEMKAPQK